MAFLFRLHPLCDFIVFVLFVPIYSSYHTSLPSFNSYGEDNNAKFNTRYLEETGQKMFLRDQVSTQSGSQPCHDECAKIGTI